MPDLINIVTFSEESLRSLTKMDPPKKSLTNISIKKQSDEYSLKKDACHSASGGDDIESEKSGHLDVAESVDDEKEPLRIKASSIRPYDILCGRDKATFNNVGNRRFRVLVSINIPRYEKAKTKAQKAEVIKYICNVFRTEVGVRFLKKHSSGEGYIELNISEARKKVGHALRDMSVARQQLNKKRESLKKIGYESQKRQRQSTRQSLIPEFDDTMLEPVPLAEKYTFSKSHAESRNPQKQYGLRPTSRMSEQQYKPGVFIDQAHRKRQQQTQNQPHALVQEQQHHLQNKLDQALFRLDQQRAKLEREQRLLQLDLKQRKLQEERQQLLHQHQDQQQHLEQQFCNQHRQHQQQQEEAMSDFDYFLNAMQQQQQHRR